MAGTFICYHKQLNWTTAEDAEDEFKLFERSLEATESTHDFMYYNDPIELALRNPQTLADFVFSGVMPPNGYEGLNVGQTAKWHTEHNAWIARNNQVNTLRSKHRAISNVAISALENAFKLDSIERGSLVALRTQLRAQLPVLDPAAIYYTMRQNLFTHFKPNKPTNAAHLISLLTNANFHDGRGFLVNSAEFIATAATLETMNQLPLLLVMQQNVFNAISAFPTLQVLLISLDNDNRADEEARVLGVALPIIPRWKSTITSCENHIRTYHGWDYCTTGKSSSYNTQKPLKPSGICQNCGRTGHTKDICRSTRCICGRVLGEGPCCNLQDAVHNKSRKDYADRRLAYPPKTGKYGPADSSTKPPRNDDRNLSRKPPASSDFRQSYRSRKNAARKLRKVSYEQTSSTSRSQSQSPTERKLAAAILQNEQDMRTIYKINNDIEKMNQEGYTLYQSNRQLRDDINRSCDQDLHHKHSLSNAVTLFTPSKRSHSG
jgi:hypothetical protein